MEFNAGYQSIVCSLTSLLNASTVQ